MTKAITCMKIYLLNQNGILAHLIQRLIGELIGYSWSSIHLSVFVVVVRTSVLRRCSQCSNIFSSETAGPIKAKFDVEPPWVVGTNVYSRHSGSHDQDSPTPIYGKNPSKIFSGTKRPKSM